MDALEFQEWKALTTVQIEEQEHGTQAPKKAPVSDPLLISQFFKTHH